MIHATKGHHLPPESRGDDDLDDVLDDESAEEIRQCFEWDPLMADVPEAETPNGVHVEAPREVEEGGAARDRRLRQRERWRRATRRRAGRR